MDWSEQLQVIVHYNNYTHFGISMGHMKCLQNTSYFTVWAQYLAECTISNNGLTLLSTPNISFCMRVRGFLVLGAGGRIWPRGCILGSSGLRYYSPKIMELSTWYKDRYREHNFELDIENITSNYICLQACNFMSFFAIILIFHCFKFSV